MVQYVQVVNCQLQQLDIFVNSAEYIIVKNVENLSLKKVFALLIILYNLIYKYSLSIILGFTIRTL